MIDVAGVVTSACVPEFAALHEPAAETPGGRTLAAAGATVVGKTVTDQLAYALTGTTMPTGPPVNVRAPGRITGGSSAGSAAAVAAGSSTSRSAPTPAARSACRRATAASSGGAPTHGRVDARGIVHLARSFDTVGLLARELALIETAADLLLDDDTAPPIASATWVTELTDRVGPAPCSLVAAHRCVPALTDVTRARPHRAAGAFRALQGREAWLEHGAFLESARPALHPDIAARFETASQVTDAEVEDARAVRAEVARAVRDAPRTAPCSRPGHAGRRAGGRRTRHDPRPRAGAHLPRRAGRSTGGGPARSATTATCRSASRASARRGATARCSAGARRCSPPDRRRLRVGAVGGWFGEHRVTESRVHVAQSRPAPGGVQRDPREHGLGHDDHDTTGETEQGHERRSPSVPDRSAGRRRSPATPAPSIT